MTEKNGDIQAPAATPPRAGFWTPHEMAERLADAPIQWCVIGGWALDLWLGFESRPHKDLEIALPRVQFQALCRRLGDLEAHSVGQGEVVELAPGAPLPAERHQARFLDVAEGAWRVDVMVDPGDADTWIYRRDERLQVARRQLMGWRGPIPYMKPEGVFLFKAKAPREKDEKDFDRCLALLPEDASSWLSRWLQDLYPQHPWLPRLHEQSERRTRG
jgi:aminoglycoside-2''-adenylyltransferase